jgi:hypothetical protein
LRSPHLAFACLATFGAACTRAGPVDVDGAAVEQVDHVLVASPESGELFALFTDTLELPVAWPLADHGGFRSGGVALGGVTLEILQVREPSAPGEGPRWVGLALDPGPLDASLAVLDGRRIRRGEAAPFRAGGFRTRWTTVALPGVSGDAFEVFLCRYAEDAGLRRQRLLAELSECGGGTLRVREVREVVVGARNPLRARESWEQLLHPVVATAEGVFALASGPAIRVREADREAIVGIVVAVEDLGRARSVLERHGGIEEVEGGGIRWIGPFVRGLEIVFVPVDPSPVNAARRREPR